MPSRNTKISQWMSIFDPDSHLPYVEGVTSWGVGCALEGFGLKIINWKIFKPIFSNRDAIYKYFKVC